MRGAGQGDGAGLERLAQHFQRLAAELRQFVEKQHAAMGKAGLARPWSGATADECCGAGTVVRVAKGPAPEVLHAGAVVKAVQGRAGEGLLHVRRRQQTGQPARQQRFSRTRWTHQNQVVIARGGYFKCTPRQRLSGDLHQVGVGHGRLRLWPVLLYCKPVAAVEVSAQCEQVLCGDDATPGYGGGQRRARRRGYQCAPCGAAGQRCGDDARHRSHGTAQGQFANKFVVGESRCWQLPGGGKNAQRDGQVEAATFLGQIGRCQVDGDTPVGKLEVGLLQSAAHPVAALAHGGFRQPDNLEGGQPVAEVGFHLYQGRFYAYRSAAVNDGQFHGSSLSTDPHCLQTV